MMVIVVESAVGTGQLKRKKKSAIGTERLKPASALRRR